SSEGSKQASKVQAGYTVWEIHPVTNCNKPGGSNNLARPAMQKDFGLAVRLRHEKLTSMKAEVVVVDPDPARLVAGLVDTGYVFKTAVDDVVDNSIAAEATKIDVELNMDFRGNVFLKIFDNGIGMDRDDLVNAMQYGARVRPSPASLGKFGLGLK